MDPSSLIKLSKVTTVILVICLVGFVLSFSHNTWVDVGAVSAAIAIFRAQDII